MTLPINRFTLETQIMNCWSVVDDLNMVARRVEAVSEDTQTLAAASTLQALANIYQMKFEDLFSTFEQLISAGKV